MDIRELNYDDLEDIRDLFIKVFNKPPWSMGVDKNRVEFYLDNLFNWGSFLAYGLFEKDKLIAASLGYIKPWIDGYEYFIENFFIDEDYSNKGLGKKFLDGITPLVREMHIMGILLNIEEKMEVKSFYEKAGFKELKGLKTMIKDLYFY